MANLIVNWLNKELKLSKKVNIIEEDFANGYLFGEIFNKYNQIPYFNEFKNRDDLNSKINNFKLIERAFKELSIKLERARLEDIINKKRGIATRYLYQLKMALSKKEICFENIMLKKSPSVLDNLDPDSEISLNTKQKNELEGNDLQMMTSPLIKSPIKSPIKSKIIHDIKNNTKNDLYTESNPVNRFEKFQKEQQIIIKEQNQIQEEILKNEKNIQNAKPLKSIDADLFMKRSEKNEIKHQEEQNLILKQSIDQKLVEEMRKESEFYKNRISDSLNLNNKNKLVGIDNFEKGINKLGIDLASIDPKLKKLSKLSVSTDVLMKKIQDRVHLDEMQKKEKYELKAKQSLEVKKINTDFIKRNERRNVNASANNFNKLSLKNISDISIDTSANLNLFSPLEKRIEYENYRNIINRDLLKEKKRKVHEMKIRQMFLSYQSPYNSQEKESLKMFDNKQFFNDLLKENLKERQTELSLKIKERKVNNVHMHKLVNYMIDFVEEIYNYQNEKNSEEIKIEDWRNWTSMFINNQPYSSSIKSSISYFEHDKTAEENEIKNKDENNRQLTKNNFINENITNNKFFETQDMDITNNDSLCEECELLDYLFFRGKYQTNIIPQETLNKMLDIFEIMGNDMLSKTNNSNKFKSSQLNNYKEYEPKDEDIENLTIPNAYNKNYLMTDIIDVILDLKFSEDYFTHSANKTIDSVNSNLNNLNVNNSTQQIKNKHPLKHIPIKIAILGRAFVGKKTQARLISDNYPIKIYSVEEMIKKNIEILERLEIPVDQNPKYKNLKKNEFDKIIADRQIEEQKFEPIKNSIISLRSVLENEENSQEKKDEGIIDFCIEMITADFPEKLTPQLLEEIINKQKRKKEINDEILKLKEDKNNPKAKTGTKNESQYQQELHKISTESNKGFILIDFPSTFSQANILEQKLSGYVYELGKPKTDSEKIRDNFSQILDKSFKPGKKRNLVEGGLDICIYLEGDSNECIRRSHNRKIDPSTGIIYHSEDNPPNPDDKKLMERLVGTEEIQPEESFIIESHKKFNLNINKILEFYSVFGYSKMNFKMLNKIPIISKADDSGKDYKEQVNHIFTEITQIINHMIKINEQKENEFLAQHTNVSSQKEIHFGNHPLSGTQTNSQLGNTNNNNLIHPSNIIHSVNNSIVNTSMNKDINAETNNVINNKNNHSGNEFEKNNIEVISSLQVQNLDEDDFNKYHKKYLEARRKISSLVADDIYCKWKDMFESYNSSLKHIFRCFRRQKESIVTNYNKLQDKFIEFLKRPSKKHSEIQKYQSKFNRFLDEYPDLISDEQVKAEFHQDLADLGDRIWEIVDERKDSAIEERKKIMNSGWIEKEMEKFYSNIEKVFVMEVEKFFTSLNIIRQFYLNMDSRLYHDISGFKPVEILKEDDLSSIPLEKEDQESNDYTFPRIEKIYKNAIKIILKFDDMVKSQEKLMAKNSNTNISLDISMKKASVFFRGVTNIKKQLIDSTFVDDKREIFIYEEEMKNAIKFEKNKFKYRITFMKHWAINILNNMKRVTKKIYHKLDEWIIDSIKAENDAMNNLTYYLDSHIESETKVKCEMEMDSFDIFRIVNVSEFFESENIPKFEPEVSEKSRFSGNMYLNIFKEIKSYEIYPDHIRTQTFLDVFVKKYIIEKNDNGVPNIMKDLSFINYKKFTNNFENILLQDKNSLNQTTPLYNDILNLKEIFTVILVLEFGILNKNIEEKFLNSVSGLLISQTYLTRDDFLNIELWFESENEKNYGNEKHLAETKELIFDINKDENNMLNINDLLNILSLSFLPATIRIENLNNTRKTYAEVLLF